MMDLQGRGVPAERRRDRSTTVRRSNVFLNSVKSAECVTLKLSSLVTLHVWSAVGMCNASIGRNVKENASSRFVAKKILRSRSCLVTLQISGYVVFMVGDDL